ncbi:LOW QUALITY PROTEIN: hypothetical protein BC938DRAFT_473475 [Jimgerdemannia flammicorona]|uniref:Uncharacterized protein n=1 Tax=Jimgerdemannia flammicorona TaxID=994334 RepID=A0A433QTA6_9FUNG|nr:LOW QUALITY PROTEIN: hypothetical protein BC938DRAFT_473475 [Jimgerdemannia flammicorona]
MAQTAPSNELYLRDDLSTQLLGLGLVNVLHQHTLVLKDVTLRLDVQGMVSIRELGNNNQLVNLPHYGYEHNGIFPFPTIASKIKIQTLLVDLARLAVLPKQPPQDTHTPHPEDLAGHTGISGTMAFTGASVTTDTLGGELHTNAEVRVNGGGLADNQTILDELTNVLAWVNDDGRAMMAGLIPQSRCVQDFRLLNPTIYCLTMTKNVMSRYPKTQRNHWTCMQQAFLEAHKVHNFAPHSKSSHKPLHKKASELHMCVLP